MRAPKRAPEDPAGDRTTDAAHWPIVMVTLQNVADTLNRYGEVTLIVIGDTILKVIEDRTIKHSKIEDLATT